jgi:hypothetical protein
MMRRSRVIHASELTDYGYCARSWYLRRVASVKTQGNSRHVNAGELLHRRHGMRVALIPILRTIAVALLLLAAALFVFGVR